MSAESQPKGRPLIPLSWEHHYGLVVSRRINLGIRNSVSPDRIVSYILQAWNDHIHSHFETEETVLLPAIKSDNTRSIQIIERVKKDHETLRKIIESFKKGKAESRELMNFATILHDHIRFEERELFPLVEVTVTREKLKEIDSILYESFREIKDSWTDKFWLS